jgi:DNA (cytosine-5)-methyltransferase 1
VKPRVIILENVEEFQTWGPVRRGRPIKSKTGSTFQKWLKQLRELGYTIDHRELIAADYGAPTIRKRFFLIARCDGKPIRWPEPTHAAPDSETVKAGRLKPQRTAAEIIDWTLPCPSIFDTPEEIWGKYELRTIRPLADATLRRIARGLRKFVFETPEPFVVDFKYDNGPKSAKAPLRTITGVNGYGIVTPYIMPNNENNIPAGVTDQVPTVTTGNRNFLIAPTLVQYHGEQNRCDVRGQTVESPLLTADAANRYGLVTAFLSKYFSGGYTGAGVHPSEPIPTVTSIDHNAVVTCHLTVFRNHSDGQSITEPVHPEITSAGHFSEAQAFLMKYYGQGDVQELREPLHTITAQDRFGLVTVKGEEYAIVDIGLRMLTPRELFNTQGFPPDYRIDRGPRGETITKAAQVARCGNAVPPPFAAAIVRANFPEWRCRMNEKQTRKGRTPDPNVPKSKEPRRVSFSLTMRRQEYHRILGGWNGI